ncbi:hypothetical protein L218DRAFT_955081 [Marasmius fiardii PR-910]|nr:hypothetical protein L218DRAFT_955081 [Marasmius fiardii PR-910]
MPPAPKTPPSKKAPKAKGAVRAKSGCYTCRIRRKKCDERPDEQGRCETCVRLRLQCLGFGAKRPDWLRESSNVSDIRGKIKQFLASQGMIKGHSGPSSRTAPASAEEQQEERVTLKLASEAYPSSASESPPNNLLVLSNEDLRHTQVSNVRGGEEGPGPGPNPWGSPSFPTGSATYESQPILHHSPQPESPPFYPQEAPAYDPSLMNHNSTTLASWAPPPIDPALVPIHASSYGHSYSYTPDDEDIYMAYGGASSSENSPTNALILAPIIYGQGTTDEWMQHYTNVIIGKQYQLANDLITKIASESVQSGTARSAAQLLALVHFQRTKRARYGDQHVPALKISDISNRYKQLQEVLKKEHHDNSDAVGALNVVSAFLFDGGYGEWLGWLKIAVTQSRKILGNQRYLSYKDALVSCSSLEQFIVKTTIWFDVLASVTTMEPPALYDVIQDIFDPNKTSNIREASSDEHAETLSMMAIMGCEGRIIWALAQVSRLAKNKEDFVSRGALDTKALVQSASVIESYLHPPDPSLFANELPHRKIISEVFRHAARLYLFTVVHGDFPNVKPIIEAVEATSAALQRSRTALLASKDRHIVIRSTVFAVFLCGCLCQDKDAQNRKINQLAAGGEDEIAYGNYKGVLEVIEKVWAHRTNSTPREPVPWRQKLRECQLLLV